MAPKPSGELGLCFYEQSSAQAQSWAEPEGKACELGSAQVQARDQAERSWALEPQQLSFFWSVVGLSKIQQLWFIYI